MPVKFLSSPRRALRYSPFTSRRSASASGVSTNTSKNSPAVNSSRAMRRSERNRQMNQPRIHHEPRDLRDTADVLDAVLGSEAQVLVESVAHVVAIEEIGVAAGGREALLDAVGNGGFAGAGEAGQPQHARLLPLQPRAQLPVDIERLPVHVLRAPQR